MRITETVYLIGSGSLGTGMSHGSDCNVYAVDCDGPYVLIDAGAGQETHRLLAALRADGIEEGQVRLLFLTHGHLDHSGGAGLLREHLKLEVCASESCARALENADEKAISLDAARAAGVYPDEFEFRACPVDRKFRGGERFRVGNFDIEVIATPGHCHDMVSYLFSNSAGSFLFSGDTVFHGGKIVVSAIYDCDVQKYISSLRKLGQYNIDGLFPGHGLWSVSGAARHLRAATDALDRLLLPPNLL